jgi:hypothetical protein
MALLDNRLRRTLYMLLINIYGFSSGGRHHATLALVLCDVILTYSCGTVDKYVG